MPGSLPETRKIRTRICGKCFCRIRMNERSIIVNGKCKKVKRKKELTYRVKTAGKATKRRPIVLGK